MRPIKIIAGLGCLIGYHNHPLVESVSQLASCYQRVLPNI